MEHYESGRSGEQKVKLPKLCYEPCRPLASDNRDRHQDPFNRDDSPCNALSAAVSITIPDSQRLNYFARSAPYGHLRGNARERPNSHNRGLPLRPPSAYRAKPRHDEESFELLPTYEESTRSEDSIRKLREAPAARPARQLPLMFPEDSERGSDQTSPRPRVLFKYRYEILALILVAVLVLGVVLARTT